MIQEDASAWLEAIITLPMIGTTLKTFDGKAPRATTAVMPWAKVSTSELPSSNTILKDKNAHLKASLSHRPLQDRIA